MLKDLELGKDLWVSYFNSRIQLQQVPFQHSAHHITPYERIFGHPPQSLTFGSSIQMFHQDSGRNPLKTDDKALECCLIGYEGYSIYVVVDSDKKRLQSRNVIFMEGRANRHNKDEPASIVSQCPSPHRTSTCTHEVSITLKRSRSTQANEPKGDAPVRNVGY